MPKASDIIRHGLDRRSQALSRGGAREHERDLWIIVQRQSLRPGTVAPPPATAVRIEPRPRIKERAIEAVMIGVSGGVEGINLQRYEVTAISRHYNEVDLIGATCFLVVEGNPALTDEQLLANHAAGKCTRYRIDGSPNRLTSQWTMMLVEDNS